MHDCSTTDRRYLATGGGSVMDAQTRALIGEKGVSIWLKADIDVLLKRTKRRNDRPLAEKIKDLLPIREPLYAQADIVVQSRDEPHDTIVDEIMSPVAATSWSWRWRSRHDRAIATDRTERGEGRAWSARL